MLRDGPIPAFAHGIAEYVLGALLIALPLLLNYDSGAATAASIIIGLGLIVIAASTDWSVSLVNSIPRPAHLVLDFAVAALMIASPFLFGFSDETDPTAIFLTAGVLQVLVAIGTRFIKEDPAEPARRGLAGPDQRPRSPGTAPPPAGAEERAKPAPGSASAPVGDRGSARRER